VTPPLIEPDWPAPANVLALSTTRLGGCSDAPFASFNLGDHVGDNAGAVAANRKILSGVLPDAAAVSWLSQVHGTTVVEACRRATPTIADAQWSRMSGVACAVLTADCLPVLLCTLQGDVVAAAHAGWRGLLAGVLEASVESMNASPDQLMAWLGPAIGPSAFEVGAEVRDGFLATATPSEKAAIAGCFIPAAHRPDHYFGDLYGLAHARLLRMGVTRIFGGDACTYSNSARFFSYRRDGQTGRMASLILLR
jgi:purine-nucleoside/S-methyl-5'-thioadenosine phosphorylase / adenosine deaminase